METCRAQYTGVPTSRYVYVYAPFKSPRRKLPFPIPICGTTNDPISHLSFPEFENSSIESKQNNCLFYCHYPLSCRPIFSVCLSLSLSLAPKLQERITPVTASMASAARTPYPGPHLRTGAETRLRPPANRHLLPALRPALAAGLRGSTRRLRALTRLPPRCRALPGASGSRNALPVTAPALRPPVTSRGHRFPELRHVPGRPWEAPLPVRSRPVPRFPR